MKLILRGFLMLMCIALVNEINAQNFTSYFTGDTADVVTATQRGLVLMGGASEQDDAMQWFLERAGGGDVVVIRASGSDGYNNYLYSSLGIDVNSVETIKFHNAAASEDPYVLQQLENAEAIWIAGGNQWHYVNYWRDSPVQDIINAKLLTVPVGGLSAGMAILGTSYFSAQNGTVTSSAALNNPFNNDMQLGHNDFLDPSWAGQFVTDTHYDDPDRRGRHAAFLARMWADASTTPLGIACTEYVAVCIDGNLRAYAYGEYPAYQEFVYFLRPGCSAEVGPETLEPGVPLNWIRDQKALAVYRVNATGSGTNYLDLNDWLTGEGGVWQDWWIEDGDLETNASDLPPDCPISTGDPVLHASSLEIYPNPASSQLTFESEAGTQWFIRDAIGRTLGGDKTTSTRTTVSVANLPAGSYLLSTMDRCESFVVRR